MTQTIDTLFINAIVLTMDEKLTQYDPGALAVKGDSIVAVGFEADLKKEYSANEIID
jgi:5-methylthioadenosine/S-adenosylhomocysteine deaminase